MRLEVTDPAQVQVAAAEREFGAIDVLVNSAGRGSYGSVEGTADAVGRDMFDLNFCLQMLYRDIDKSVVALGLAVNALRREAPYHDA
jgi:NAD(P)-dependent dehydrogenase (short-subunit alcohol dehydrogenase family)